MTDVYQLPNPERVEEEAGDWIARLNADKVTEEDRARFAAWRSAHQSHARTYDAMSTAWRAFTAAAPLVRAVSFGQSINELTRPVNWRRRLLIATAAATVIVAATLSFYMIRWPPETLFQTAIGEHATISLPDGSSVDLNSDSRVRVDYSDRARVVRLERGEAFFRVAHDASHPFWVVGGGSWARAVGTAFDVYLRPAGVRVTVTEGKVQVGSADASPGSARDAAHLEPVAASFLLADQQVDLQGGASSIRTLPQAEIRRSMAWRSGKVYFERQPLGEVVAELQRYTSLRIIVNDEQLRKLPVGGRFQANEQGAESLLSMLRDGFGLRVRRETRRVYIEDASGSRSD